MDNKRKLDNKTCPLLLAGLMANPNVADKDGNISNIAETKAQCGDWCKRRLSDGECVTRITRFW